MAVEPIIVVLGVRCGGTSAVAGVLHRLGVFMGSEFGWASRELNETWEDSNLIRLCSRAFSESGDVFQWDAGVFQAKLRGWADNQRRDARNAGSRPGAKDPRLCLAVDHIRNAWDPIVPVVVDRPFGKVVASLNRLEWFADEQERAASTAHLIAARDHALAGTATVKVDFEALRATPANAVRRLADELRLEVTEAQVKAAVQSIVRPANIGERNADPAKHARDHWLAELQRDPENPRMLSLLASTFFITGDFANARKWYARRVQLGGLDEGYFFALYQLAESMERLGEPWPDVQDTYLKAWQSRPTRAEPLQAIAERHRIEKRYQLGYLFAERAARIPLPTDDTIFDRVDIHTWRATDEQAICAGWIGNKAEAFTLNRRLLARPDIPDHARQRIARNRDFSVPNMIEAASSYSDAPVQRLVANPGTADVVVSLIAGPDPAATELTLNSFLHCCTDVTHVGQFLVLDVGLTAQDRAELGERYGFLQFTDCHPEDGPGAQLAHIHAQIHQRYWLHLDLGWQFFAPEDFITRLTAVLKAEAQVFQVGINFADAATLTGACAPERAVHRAPDAGRYVLTDEIASGPAMFDTTRLDQAGGINGTDPDPITELRRRTAAAALHTATLDEVLCTTAI